MQVKLWTLRKEGRTVGYCLDDKVDGPFPDWVYVLDEPNLYQLPDGYTIGEIVTGEKAIFDEKDSYCDIVAAGAHNQTVSLISVARIVYISKIKGVESE